ncbi:hypothetical protein LSS_02949 [Leptospira santarosai serovar Shermani str. LT 821]|uniref:Uncharacterized protein n=1 Tax=Leptospira santarosai serovar Shermani str. LT 821 TaxID=758847 RepID=K8Y4F7_9LEPT|nr:hypothetical protein LSS_02949 [Leptospira santarosai serovar Shermani str. LT 821]
MEKILVVLIEICPKKKLDEVALSQLQEQILAA